MAIGKFQIVSNTIGHIVACDVSEDMYLKNYARFYHDWVNGTVVKLPSIDAGFLPPAATARRSFRVPDRAFAVALA